MECFVKLLKEISHGNVKISIGYLASNLLVDNFDPQIEGEL